MSESTDQFDQAPADAAQAAHVPVERGQASGAVPPPRSSLQGRWNSHARRSTGGASGGAARPAQERQRWQALARLQEEILGVRAAIARNREELGDLLRLEGTRRLLPAERVRALRWEAEELLYEVSLLRERFEELRDLRGV